MELFFLSGPYNRDQKEDALINEGFKKTQNESLKNFCYLKGGFRVHLTSHEEGKIQVQIWDDEKGFPEKGSKGYSTLEKLAKLLEPTKIVDAGFCEHYPEFLE